MNTYPSEIIACWQAACDVRQKAYAPYSKYLVGSALLTTQSDQIFVGCNVENASYGATICAERNAILSAVATCGHMTIQDLVLVTRDPAPPCGMCLQVITEFAGPETRIYLATPEKISHKHALKDFLPLQFSPINLEND